MHHKLLYSEEDIGRVFSTLSFLRKSALCDSIRVLWQSSAERSSEGLTAKRGTCEISLWTKRGLWGPPWHGTIGIEKDLILLRDRSTHY